MRYKKIKSGYKPPQEIWAGFKAADKIMIYDTGKQSGIMGIDPLSDDLATEQLFTFHTLSFDEQVNSSIWQGMSEISQTYRIYIEFNKSESIVYYLGEKPVFQTTAVTRMKHKYCYRQNDYDDWCELFNGIKKQMEAEDIQKVVASREVILECEDLVNVESILEKLICNNSGSFVFAYQREGKVFLGATPEILVRKKGAKITSYALAGTIAKDGQQDVELGRKLLNDTKNRHEHNIVIETISNRMRKNNNEVRIGSTGLRELKNLYHLESKITIQDESHSLLEWAQMLHPTPAMGGKPADKAMAMIRKYEKHDRGLFAAPIGMVDQHGDGIFIVGIRSALVEKNKVHLYAGCGIVEQSDCQQEYQETNNKLQTVLECL